MYCPSLTCFNVEPCIQHQSAEILGFWFGDEKYDYRSGLWWKGISPTSQKVETPAEAQLQTDNFIRERFGWLLNQISALDERLVQWGTSAHSPKERIAFVILLDQFSRNAYRGTERMFALDSLAQATASDLLSNYRKDLDWNHCMFACVALEHSEDVNVVEKALIDVRILTAELEGIPEAHSMIHHMRHLIVAFQAHIKTLRKFGRYPHRNEILGRQSTPEEAKWLSGKLPAWAKSTRPLKVVDEKIGKHARSSHVPTTRKPLRILMLHGNRSSLGKFRKKTKVAFGALTAQGHLLHYINAPHVYAKQENDEKRDRITAGLDNELQHQVNRCWWTATDDPATMVYNGLQESIDYLESVFENEGPFDGVLGFAQGACMAAILAALQSQGKTKHIRFKFLVNISGFYCRDTRQEYSNLHVIRYKNESGVDCVDPITPKISLPSFHTWGLQDELVEGWRTEMLSRAFANAQTSPHPAGHFTSALNQWPVQVIADWVQSLNFEPAQSLKMLRSFKEILITIASCRHDEFVTSNPHFADLPVALSNPSIQDDPFWTSKGQVLLHNNGLRQQDCAQFVARSLALSQSPAQNLDIIDDLLLLGWTIFPFKTPPKNKAQSHGEVFFWLFYQTYMQADPAGKQHILTSRLPLLAEFGNWAALVRLALLDATGSSLRQGMDTNELKDKNEIESSKEEGPEVDALQNGEQILARLSELNRSIADLFTNQLLSDYESVNRLGEDLTARELDYDALVVKRLDLISKGGTFPSSCATQAPRMQTYVSRTTNVPQAIAALLLQKWKYGNPPKFANTLYRTVLTSILGCLKTLSKDNLSRMRAPDLSWYSLSSEDWEKLKESPLSSAVVNPEPEPVDVSSSQQLQPLYDFLRSGKDLFQMRPRLNKGIQELSFERGTICSDGRLDLCKQVIGPSGVEDLMETLRADSAKQSALVRHILLGNNVAGDSLASGVAQFIRSGQSKLTTWYIAGNRLTGEGLLPLTDALADDKQVRQLWLKRNPLRLRGAEALSQLLCTNHYLQVLDLTTTGLLDEGVEALMTGLTKNQGLQYLYLDGNGITLSGLQHLKGYLLSHKGCLQGLSVGCNRIGDEGARIISEGLMDHPTIKRLVLSSSGIGAKGAEALAELLLANSTLLYLDLGFQNMTAALREAPNRIGSAGAIALAKALRINRTLKSLDITQNQIYQDGMAALQKAICAEDNGLVELKMQQFGVPLNELTLEQLRLHVRKQRLAGPLAPEVEEALRPAHLTEIASVYRVGHAYKDEKAPEEKKETNPGVQLPTLRGDGETKPEPGEVVTYLDSSHSLLGLGAGDSELKVGFLTEEEADQTFERLQEGGEIAYQQWYHMPNVTKSKRIKPVPLAKLRRVKVAQALPTTDGLMPHYRFPVNDQQRYGVSAMSPTVAALCNRVNEATGWGFNHAVVLLYRGDQDCIGFHQDKTLDLAPGTPIASISLGAERPYVLKNKITQATEVVEFVLPHGGLLLLGAKSNAEYYHSVRELSETPPLESMTRKYAQGKVRVSITFRVVATFRDPKTNVLTGQGASYQTLNWPHELRGIHRLDDNLDQRLPESDSEEEGTEAVAS